MKRSNYFSNIVKSILITSVIIIGYGTVSSIMKSLERTNSINSSEDFYTSISNEDNNEINSYSENIKQACEVYVPLKESDSFIADADIVEFKEGKYVPVYNIMEIDKDKNRILVEEFKNGKTQWKDITKLLEESKDGSGYKYFIELTKLKV